MTKIIPESEEAWQTIKTAPKDGTAILCWCPDVGVRVLTWDGGWELCGVTLSADYKPSHWMPLPAPPQVRAQLAGKGA